MTLQTLLARAAASVALAVGAASAGATPQDYTFVVTLSDVAGTTYSGSLSFDDDPAGGTPGSFGETLFELTAFSFDFIDETGAAKTYGIGSLASKSAAVDGGLFVGFDADEVGRAFQFLSALPSGIGLVPSFAYTFPASFGDGTVAFTRVPGAPVPVPATAALALAGLGALGCARRRRQA